MKVDAHMQNIGTRLTESWATSDDFGKSPSEPDHLFVDPPRRNGAGQFRFTCAGLEQHRSSYRRVQVEAEEEILALFSRLVSLSS